MKKIIEQETNKQILVLDSIVPSIAIFIEYFHNKNNRLEISVSDPGDKKFDLIFISAKSILLGIADPIKIKNQHGKEGVKIVAMSILQDYLNELSSRKGIDFFIHKDSIIGFNQENLKKEDQELLKYFFSD